MIHRSADLESRTMVETCQGGGSELVYSESQPGERWFHRIEILA